MQLAFDLRVLSFTTQTNLFSVFSIIFEMHIIMLLTDNSPAVQSYEPSGFKNHTITTPPQAMHHKLICQRSVVHTTIGLASKCINTEQTAAALKTLLYGKL